MDIEVSAKLRRGCSARPPVTNAWQGMLLHGATRSTRFSAVWLALFWLLVTGCAPSTGQSPCCGKLRVNVRTESAHKADERPVADVRVELYPMQPGPGLAFETDRRGFGAHIGVPVGTYRVRFTHPDFMPVEVTDVVIHTWPAVELNVHLPPRIADYPNIIRRVRHRPPLIDTEGGSIRYVIRN